MLKPAAMVTWVVIVGPSMHRIVGILLIGYALFSMGRAPYY